jgi:hypothetical protein
VNCKHFSNICPTRSVGPLRLKFLLQSVHNLKVADVNKPVQENACCSIWTIFLPNNDKTQIINGVNYFILYIYIYNFSSNNIILENCIIIFLSLFFLFFKTKILIDNSKYKNIFILISY